jgi:hypothetical protein
LLNEPCGNGCPPLLVHFRSRIKFFFAALRRKNCFVLNDLAMFTDAADLVVQFAVEAFFVLLLLLPFL